MDDESLDLTEKTPSFDLEAPSITVPNPVDAVSLPPLTLARAAHGTRTRITALPPPLPSRSRRPSGAPPLPMPLAAGTTSTKAVAPNASRRSTTTIPPPIPTRGRATVPPPIPAQALVPTPAPLTSIAPLVLPLPAPATVPPPLAAHDQEAIDWSTPTPLPIPIPYETNAFEQSVDISVETFDDRPFLGTPELEDDEEYVPPRRRNVGALIALGLAGVLVLTVVIIAASSGSKTTPTTTAAATPVKAAATATPIVPVAPTPVAPTPVAAPAPAPAPVAAPVEVAAAAAPAPTETAPAEVPTAMVQVPISSTPAGATITLIADGNATVVGRTPMIAELDPAHHYDVVLALQDHPTMIQHVIDPKAVKKIAIDLEPAKPAVAVVAPAPAKPSVAVAAPAPAPAPVKATPAPTPAPVHRSVAAVEAPRAPTPAKPTTVASATNGILMVSTKPPCDIAIDGRSLHLTTPQRAISLPPGQHSLTLVNAQQKISKTISVSIATAQSTRVIQDFLH